MSAALPLDMSYQLTGTSRTKPQMRARRFVGLAQQSPSNSPLLSILQQNRAASEYSLTEPPELIATRNTATDPLPSRLSANPAVHTARGSVDILSQLLSVSLSSPHATEDPAERHARLALSIETAARSAPDQDWDNYGAHYASAESKRHALEFVRRLPASLPAPEALVDRDGDMNLEWYHDPSQVFTVSFGADGTLSYAGLFRSAKVYGSERLGEDTLFEIIHNIKRVWRD